MFGKQGRLQGQIRGKEQGEPVWNRLKRNSRLTHWRLDRAV